jgi:hypothetical protein
VKDADALIEKAARVKPDVIFMLKLLDTLETIKRHHTKKLIPRLAEHAQWIVVSFATQSLGGNKTISDSRRTWFESFLARQKESCGWTYDTFSIPNEKFYLIRTSR